MICMLLPLPFSLSIRRSLKYAGIIFTIVLLGVVIFLTINVMQRGLGGPDGRSMDDILGISAAKATKADMEKLSKYDLMQLFYAAHAPDPKKMGGEFKGKNLPVGISFPIIKYVEVNIWGPPGDWSGKRFTVCDDNRCPGINLFDVVTGNGKTKAVAARKMVSSIQHSVFDERQSMVLDYEKDNTDVTRRIVDEIRQINANLYIGLAYVKFPPGTWHCFPFVLWRD
ncbi:MAG: hypothetical protein JXX14_25035 [Deltaproteobacteria bacterium]|nr:hypothetical protein [Deltaproteobacteria bacterium]